MYHCIFLHNFQTNVKTFDLDGTHACTMRANVMESDRRSLVIFAERRGKRRIDPHLYSPGRWLRLPVRMYVCIGRSYNFLPPFPATGPLATTSEIGCFYLTTIYIHTR